MFKKTILLWVFVLGLLIEAKAQNKYYNIRSFRNEDLNKKTASYQYFVWDSKKITVTTVNNTETEEPNEYGLITKQYQIEKKDKNTMLARRVPKEKKVAEKDSSMYIFIRTVSMTYAPDFVQLAFYENKNKENLLKRVAETGEDYYREVLVSETFLEQVKKKPVLSEDVSKADFMKMLEIIKTKLKKAQDAKEEVNENSLMLTAIAEAGYNSFLSKKNFKNAVKKYKEDPEAMKQIEEIERLLKGK